MSQYQTQMSNKNWYSYCNAWCSCFNMNVKAGNYEIYQFNQAVKSGVVFG